MSTRSIGKDIGVWAALASALLFGAGTPLAKALLDGQSGKVSPWVLAGLLYAGSGLGLSLSLSLSLSPPFSLAIWFSVKIRAP